jgi:hypothetical protein
LALHSRSPQIAAAARAAFFSWAASLQLWLVAQGAVLTLGYAAIDLGLAAYFFHMSRGRWFPVPLCFLHALLVGYHLCTLFNTGGVFWEKFALNRAFDAELSYIIVCAVFRMTVLREGRVRARG